MKEILIINLNSTGDFVPIFNDIVESVKVLTNWNNCKSDLQVINDKEVYWALPEVMGNGFVSIMELKPGVVLTYNDFEFDTELSGCIDYSYRHISFVYSVAGDFSMTDYTDDLPFYSCRNGYELLSSYPIGEVENTPPPEKGPFKCVAIYLDPACFFSVFPGMDEQVHPDLVSIAQGDDKTSFYQELPATVNVQMAVRDILTCTFEGPCRRLFLESKTMELMTQTLWRSYQLMHAANDKGLRPADIERVNNAKKYMDIHFREDIKLLDIAHIVGLPHTKLNLYFRQLHGTTVFGYLRELRMNEARFLLSKGATNVTEAAYSVGYSSLSHFAKVFKKHCGQAPGDFMRQAHR